MVKIFPKPLKNVQENWSPVKNLESCTEDNSINQKEPLDSGLKDNEITRQNRTLDETSIDEKNNNNSKELGKRREIRSVEQLTYFQGPIPSPEILKQYNVVVPNGAERIFKMAENQSRHRLEMEKTDIAGNFGIIKRGQFFGFSLGLIAIIATVVLALTGHDTVAIVFGTTTIVGLVSAFLVFRQGKPKNLTEEENEPTE